MAFIMLNIPNINPIHAPTTDWSFGMAPIITGTCI